MTILRIIFVFLIALALALGPFALFAADNPIAAAAVVSSETDIPQSILGQAALGVGGIGASLLAAILYMRRKISRDGVEMVKDRVESDILTAVIKERELAMKDAREAWSQLNQLVGENAMLKERAASQKAELDRLYSHVDRLQNYANELKKAIKLIQKGETPDLPSDMMPLN